MKRIEVDAGSIQVVGGGRRRAAGPPPPQTGIGAFLRRHRLRAAALIAAIELLVFVFGSRPEATILMLIAIGAIVVHFAIGSRLPYAARQVTWMAAVAQALVALFPVLFGLTTLAVLVMLFGAVLIGLMLVLGDRK